MMHKTMMAACLGLFLTAAAGTARAQDAGAYEGFRFQVGLTLASGVSDLIDKIKANNPQFDIRKGVPGGVAFAAYRDFGNDLGAGVTVGPAIFGAGDASFHVVPVGLDLRYRVARSETLSTYVRAGVEKAFAGGDFVAGSGAGGTAAVGIEAGRARGFGWGVELGYHSAEVKVLATSFHGESKARPGEFTVSGFFRF